MEDILSIVIASWKESHSFQSLLCIRCVSKAYSNILDGYTYEYNPYKEVLICNKLGIKVNFVSDYNDINKMKLNSLHCSIKQYNNTYSDVKCNEISLYDNHDDDNYFYGINEGINKASLKGICFNQLDDYESLKNLTDLTLTKCCCFDRDEIKDIPNLTIL